MGCDIHQPRILFDGHLIGSEHMAQPMSQEMVEAFCCKATLNQLRFVAQYYLAVCVGLSGIFDKRWDQC